MKENKNKKYKIIKKMTDANNYQKSTIPIKCYGCNKNCELVYDRHHDQTFSLTCGRVIIESGNILINYPADPYYWETQKQKREEAKQLKKIIEKLKELNITYTITDDLQVTIPSLTTTEQSTINNMCSDKDFKLIYEKKYSTKGKYLGGEYKIKKETETKKI